MRGGATDEKCMEDSEGCWSWLMCAFSVELPPLSCGTEVRRDEIVLKVPARLL